MFNRHTYILCASVMLAGCATTQPGPTPAPTPAKTTATASTASAPRSAHAAAPVPPSPPVAAATQSPPQATVGDDAHAASTANEPAAVPARASANTKSGSTNKAPEQAARAARDSAAATARRAVSSHPGTSKPRPEKPVAQDASTLSGTLQLKAGNGQQIGTADFAHTVVYFVPSTGDARPQPGNYTVYTHNRDFDPAWLAIPQGSTVTFTNLDQVTHNVFSVTPGAAFDLAYQSAGQSDPHRFDRPGMVLISCHVHRYMKGGVLVVPSRYVTTVSANGRFRLRHLPPVSGTLYFWNPRSQAATQQIRPPFSDVKQQLLIDQPAVKTQIDVGGGS